MYQIAAAEVSKTTRETVASIWITVMRKIWIGQGRRRAASRIPHFLRLVNGRSLKLAKRSAVPGILLAFVVSLPIIARAGGNVIRDGRRLSVDFHEVPRVIDFVDALSLNFQQRSRRAAQACGPARSGPPATLRARNLPQVDHATVVSPVDRGAIGDFPNLSVNRNGVDLFDYAFRRGGRDPYAIVFVSNLGYFSNADAICWFAREIFPHIRREEPRARLLVVGARPGRKVRSLAGLDSRIAVKGFVERPQAYLERCGMAIAPMRVGSGQLFKVMEAMACGAPLIATRLATAGTEAESERHFLAAETPEAFARQGRCA
jgi:glycosyltransferase involved in cell wall biosynthesis